MPLEEGRAKFGGKFMDATGATRKHLARMTVDRCTPHHNGKVFFNAHAAYTLEIEQSLQLIDSTIAMPFWDYTIDSKFFGLDWANSEIWSGEWFGTSTSPTSDRVLQESRFAYTPIRTDADGRASPARLSLREALVEWLGFRRACVVRRTTWQLRKAEAEQREGYSYPFMCR